MRETVLLLNKTGHGIDGCYTKQVDNAAAPGRSAGLTALNSGE
jgi:hypothetical protein